MRLLFDSVVFDVDSTLVTIEGLDFLADLKGKGSTLKELTIKAMNGNLSFRKSMEIKMEAISPSREDIVAMGKAYIKNITPGVKETISVLKKSGLMVWVLTGNFQPAVGMLASHIGIDKAFVITNDIYFDKNGQYLGFDVENPLSNNGGKTEIMRKFKRKMGKAVYVGDGGTDLETKEVTDLFIGFGGVVRRPKVEAGADVYITESNMKAILPFVLKDDTMAIQTGFIC